MPDPLGRKHQTVRKPKNRWRIDAVLQYVMEKEIGSFQKKLSTAHIYYQAFAIYYGEEAAIGMLARKRAAR